MDAGTAYQKLIAGNKETAVLGSCASLLVWDERTYMPKGGSPYRAEQLSFLAGMIHERLTSPHIGDLLATIEGSPFVGDPLSAEAVNVREIRRGYDRQMKLPPDLVKALARVTTLAQGAWVDARAASDFAAFRPHLEEIVKLKLEEAAALQTGETPYDALLDDYEPGETSANLDRVFGPMKTELTALAGAIEGASRKPDMGIVQRQYATDLQQAFGEAAASAIGFDMTKGRLDVTTHPFCSGIGPGDIRLTTRYDEENFAQAFFGTLHEAGHGIYEQGLDAAAFGTPMGDAVSLGIHESQSRMWENMVGRNLSFWTHFLPKLQSTFKGTVDDVSPEAMTFAVNRVERSFIRVEADEVTYNLHIILRYEMEKRLINDKLPVGDIPDAWNETFKEFFDLTPPDDANGCLQDIHWSGGGFGYFPTYSLGNIYAAQFFEQAREELGDLDAMFSTGEFLPLRDWLREKIHRQGMRYRSGDLVKEVTGRGPDAEPLMRHLRGKYGELYGLSF